MMNSVKPGASKMRCKHCPYESYDYSEGYSICSIFGDNEDYTYENEKGELGCKYNRKTIEKFVRAKQLEEKEIVRQMGDMAKFWKEQEELEAAKQKENDDAV
jgi:hypothetical protein